MMLSLDNRYDDRVNECMDIMDFGLRFVLLDDISRDEIDVFASFGLDYDELEFMDPKERRQVLVEAGLDPKDFDF